MPKVIDPNGVGGLLLPRVTSFTYDHYGTLNTVTDPLARTTSYQYDGLGRVTKETLPDPHD